MKIENLTRITGGKLLNSPYVSSVEGITFNVEKIERGNLFVDYEGDAKTHEEAVQKGAYAILTPTLPEVIDKEIAWLHVEEIELSLIKLARFFASTKDLNFILLSNLQYELIKCLQLDFQTKLLADSIKDAILEILNVKEKTLFFVTSSAFLQKIDPTFREIEPTLSAQKSFSKGLFYSSYILDDIFYPDIRLPKFLLPHLCAIQNFFDKESISYKLDNFHHFHHFHPIFVNKVLEKKDFGSTQKVLIFEKDKNLFEKAVKHILSEVGSKKLTLLLPKEEFKEYPEDIKKFPYTKNEDFLQLIGEPFHYVLIKDDFSIFETPLVAKPRQMNLF